MKRNIKAYALILACVLCMAACHAALAEETVELIGGIATTQVFSDQPVDAADLETIAQSGLSAASAINQQPWHFVVITNKDVMIQIGGSEGGQRASLGASPAAIIIYKVNDSKSPNPDFDCGLACENMVVAANALGYDTKIVSSPTMALNGERHDEICELLNVDTAYSAVAVLLIGHGDANAVSSASTRDDAGSKVSYIQ